VRTAGVHDVSAVRDLLVITWHATYDAIHGADRVTEIVAKLHAPEIVRRNIERPDAEFLVADDGTRLGGMSFATSADGGKVIRLHQLYVRPELQGRGIGGMLLDETLGCFPEARLARLDVDAANARAVTFYRGYGFEEAGKTDDCGNAGLGLPALVFERRLGDES
jgi:GNAT superfamily N-acetyltransferase